MSAAGPGVGPRPTVDPDAYPPQPAVRRVAQALFLHERLIANALDGAEQRELQADIERRRRGIAYQDDLAHVGAYEDVVARLLGRVRELGVAWLEGDLENGELVTLTQDFYIRRDNEDRGSFKAKLDSNRGVGITGRFSTSWLVGATGQSETFGHHRFTMLGYTGTFERNPPSPQVELRPVFIGWRMLGSGPLAEHDDRREVWPQQIDQFARINGKRASAADRAAVRKMSEDRVKHAFAEIIGEPFVPKDWGGETSDLYTNRLTTSGKPLSAAFAFKGPSLKGTLYIAGMGARGDQALRLAHDPADLLVVQHHDAIAAEVRNLLSSIARMHGRRFMLIDGETTAVILGEYGKLPTSERQ